MAFFEAFGFVARVLFTLIASFFSGILLWLTSKLFKTKHSGFGTALLIAFIIGIVHLAISTVLGFIPIINWFAGFIAAIVGIILGILLVKTKYELDGGKAFLLWLVWMILTSIIVGVLFAIFAVFLIGGTLFARGLF
ncbi:MAG TPA: hypothetical protein VLJ21_01215 [Candidatus Binatia bacterium]|nr:hypothetical protein [Candidatus Binatia bacterium]